jgi:hypothetical protein
MLEVVFDSGRTMEEVNVLGELDGNNHDSCGVQEWRQRFKESPHGVRP